MDGPERGRGVGEGERVIPHKTLFRRGERGGHVSGILSPYEAQGYMNTATTLYQKALKPKSLPQPQLWKHELLPPRVHKPEGYIGQGSGTVSLCLYRLVYLECAIIQLFISLV